MAMTGAGWNGSALQGTPTSMPNSRLTITTCVGCHTATTGGTIIDLGDGTKVPIVNSGGGYPANPLAGGNFNPVSGNHQKGHNVEGLAGKDSYLDIVPGQQIGGNHIRLLKLPHTPPGWLAGHPFCQRKKRRGSHLRGLSYPEASYSRLSHPGGRHWRLVSLPL